MLLFDILMDELIAERLFGMLELIVWLQDGESKLQNKLNEMQLWSEIKNILRQNRTNI